MAQDVCHVGRPNSADIHKIYFTIYLDFPIAAPGIAVENFCQFLFEFRIFGECSKRINEK